MTISGTRAKGASDHHDATETQELKRSSLAPKIVMSDEAGESAPTATGWRHAVKIDGGRAQPH
jgi:hypothetical protein